MGAQRSRPKRKSILVRLWGHRFGSGCGVLAPGAAEDFVARIMVSPVPRNVLGGPLKPCSRDPLTGFFRDGSCRTCEEDVGCHTVCTEVTAEFLAYSKAAGNDLSTPLPEYGFPGLKPGDRWCVCAARWAQALADGVPAPVVLSATHERTLEHVPLEELERHATS